MHIRRPKPAPGFSVCWLELARGGPQTQKMQKEVVARLDEIIKQLENQAKGGGS